MTKGGRKERETFKTPYLSYYTHTHTHTHTYYVCVYIYVYFLALFFVLMQLVEAAAQGSDLLVFFLCPG